MKLPIYLDYAATTPVDKRVVDKMMKYLTISGTFGNPSSFNHSYGWLAAEAVDIARNNISKIIKAHPDEIIFTSGATESNNLAIKGIAFKKRNQGTHIITSIIEHPSVLITCKYLEKNGYHVTWLEPNKNGIIIPDQLFKALRKDTILVSLMHVNNETGMIQDIKTFSQICFENNILFHVDASQSVGKLPINLSYLPIDLMSLSSHKLYGPKGIGCLFIRKNSLIKINPLIHGSGQEQNIRSGTLPVHQIVGMGEAYLLATKNINNEINRLYYLRNKLLKGLQQIDHNLLINGTIKNSIPNILNVSFMHINSKSLMMELTDIAISSGSACNSHQVTSSYVLRSMGINNSLKAQNAIRFSLGKYTTEDEIDYSLIQIKKAVIKLLK